MSKLIANSEANVSFLNIARLLGVFSPSLVTSFPEPQLIMEKLNAGFVSKMV